MINKDLLVGLGLGIVIGAVATWFGGKELIKNKAASESEEEFSELSDKLSVLYDDTMTTYADLNDYATENLEGYEECRKKFLRERENKKEAAKMPTDVDATNDKHIKASFKTVHTKPSENKPVREEFEEVEEPEEPEEIIDPGEAFSMLVEQKCATTPKEHITHDEWLNTQCRDYFSVESYIYFVKGNEAVDSDFDYVTDEELAYAFGNDWRRHLAADGAIWTIDWEHGTLRHIRCNHMHTVDSAAAKMKLTTGESCFCETDIRDLESE